MVAPFPIDYWTDPEPTAHFRHTGRVANVAFLDGHVEPLQEAAFVAPWFWTNDLETLRVKYKIGYLADQNLPYTGR